MSRTKSLAAVLLTAFAVLAFSAGCERMRGQDGLDGRDGIKGDMGETGPKGEPGELGLPCDKCVDRDSINDGSINAAKLAGLAVGDTQLAVGAVSTSKIEDLAIGTNQLFDWSVTSNKIIADSIVYGKFAPLSVAPGKFAPMSVESSDIACGAIGPGDIRNGAVIAGNLAPFAVEAGDIANLAVGESNIANLAVGTEHISTGAVTNIWTSMGRNDTSLGSPGQWETINNMVISVDGQAGGYLILFEGSFYSDYSNNSTKLRLLVETTAGSTVLNMQRLHMNTRATSTSGCSVQQRVCYQNCWRECIWIFGWICWTECEDVCYYRPVTICGGSHNHRTDQVMGSASLMWAGELPVAPPSSIVRVQWRDDSANLISQLLADGDRKLTVIEFKKAQVH